MKATDTLTMTFTGSQIAKIYASIGRMNGGWEVDVFTPIKELLDPTQEKYNSLILPMSVDVSWDYIKYRDAWEKLLFEEPKSAEQVQLDTVMDRIAELTHQAELLKALIK